MGEHTIFAPKFGPKTGKVVKMGGRSGRLVFGILWRKWRSPSHSTYENEVFGVVCAFEKKFLLRQENFHFFQRGFFCK